MPAKLPGPVPDWTAFARKGKAPRGEAQASSQDSFLIEMPMTPSDIDRLQTYLRKLFGSERIQVVQPPRKGATIELAVNDETIGTVHKDVEDGETSYSIHLTVLEEDLPAQRPAAKTVTGTSGRR
jgi:hypothetical protein